MFTGGHISFAACVKRIAAGPSEAGQSMSPCPSPQMNPLKLCRRILPRGDGKGEKSLLIPRREISHELDERLGWGWKQAKVELIGHQCLLCVKSHLFAMFYERLFPFVGPSLAHGTSSFLSTETSHVKHSFRQTGTEREL
ncbi:uncharacterized [Tachysurus ichikawai]